MGYSGIVGYNAWSTKTLGYNNQVPTKESSVQSSYKQCGYIRRYVLNTLGQVTHTASQYMLKHSVVFWYTLISIDQTDVFQRWAASLA